MDLSQSIVQQALAIYEKNRKISPFLLMRKLKITLEFAKKIYLALALQGHKDARKLAKEIEMEM